MKTIIDLISKHIKKLFLKLEIQEKKNDIIKVSDMANFNPCSQLDNFSSNAHRNYKKHTHDYNIKRDELDIIYPA